MGVRKLHVSTVALQSQSNDFVTNSLRLFNYGILALYGPNCAIHMCLL